MKYILGSILLLATWKSFGQSIFPVADSTAVKIAEHIVNCISVKHRAPSNARLWLNVDFRIKHISSDGLSWAPAEQDSSYRNAALHLDSLFEASMGDNKPINIIKQPEPGAINRIKIIEGAELGDEDIYIEIMRPIDGWDMLEVLALNYWQIKVRGGKAPLKGDLYIPVVVSVGKVAAFKNYLFKYRIDNSKGYLDFHLIKAVHSR